MINLYLDIETIPTQRTDVQDKIFDTVKPPKTIKKQESIDKWYEEKRDDVAMEKILKTGLDGAFGETMVIGFAIEDQYPQVIFRDSLQADEKEMLSTWFDTLTKSLCELSNHDNPTVRVIGHNVLNFDLRFLFNRCVVLGVKPPQWFMRCVQASPYSEEVYDTMTQWAGFRNTVSLSKLVDALGLQAKGEEIDEEIDGSQVWFFVEKGDIEAVANYCIGDVIRVQQAYQKMNFLNVA